MKTTKSLTIEELNEFISQIPNDDPDMKDEGDVLVNKLKYPKCSFEDLFDKIIMEKRSHRRAGPGTIHKLLRKISIENGWTYAKFDDERRERMRKDLKNGQSYSEWDWS